MALNDDAQTRICGVFVIFPLEPDPPFKLMTGDYFPSSKEASIFLNRQSDVLGKRLREARATKDKIAVLNGVQFVTAKVALASDWKRLRFWARYRLRFVLEKHAKRKAKRQARDKGKRREFPEGVTDEVARVGRSVPHLEDYCI